MPAVAQSFFSEVESREAESGTYFMSDQANPRLPALADSLLSRTLFLAVGLASMVAYVWVGASRAPWGMGWLIVALVGLLASVHRLRARSPRLANGAIVILTYGPPWFTVLLASVLLGGSWAVGVRTHPEAWLAFELLMVVVLTTARSILAEQNLGRGTLRQYRVRLAIALHIASTVTCALLMLNLAARIAQARGTSVPVSITATIGTAALASVAATVRRRRKVMAAAVYAIDNLRCEIEAMRAGEQRKRELSQAALGLHRALSAGVDVPWWCKAPVETAVYRAHLMGELAKLTGYRLTDDRHHVVARDTLLIPRQSDRGVIMGRLSDELLRLRAQVSRHADVAA